MPLDEAQVRKLVSQLENDPDHSRMRSEAEVRYRLYELLDKVDLPNHLSRGAVTQANSPLLGWLSDVLLAENASYPSYVTITPHDSDHQKDADLVEKWLQLWYLEVNSANVVNHETRWHQYNTGWATPVLTVNDDDEFPWEVLVPDPITCFFPIRGAPSRPKMLARKYRQVVRDIEATYVNRKGVAKGPGRAPRYGANGRWRWDEVSDDYNAEDGHLRSNLDGDPLAEVTVWWLADGKNVYHYCEGKDGVGDKGGTLLWVGEDLTGGVPAVIIPGRVTPIRRASERLKPALYPAYQMVKLINRVRAKRETRSDNLKPDIINQTDAETLKARAIATQAGVDDDELEFGEGLNIINVPGKAMLWEMQADEDLDKLEQSYWAELDRYINSLIQSTDPDVLSDSKANVYLTYAENRRAQQAPILASLDWGWARLMEMTLESIKHMNQEFSICHGGDSDLTYANGKTIKRGESVTIGPKNLNFGYRLTFQTRSITDAERRMMVQDWAYKAQLGLATLREGITATGHADETEQAKNLFAEKAVAGNAQHIDEQVRLAIQEEIRLNSDIIVLLGPQRPELGGGATGGGSAPPPSDQMPTGSPRMTAPPVGAPAGGSEPAAGQPV